jgi:hypothetical protein
LTESLLTISSRLLTLERSPSPRSRCACLVNLHHLGRL